MSRITTTTAALAVTTLASLTAAAGASAARDPYPDRPDFRVPLTCGANATLKTYEGHAPDDKKVDMYQDGRPTGAPILASASGVVHESFDPGGVEIRHGKGWFTVYLHMSSHVKPGTRVTRGQRIGTMGSVGTGVVHLHYEQLYRPGASDADTGDMKRPLIQGRGPIKMVPGRDVHMTSTNCAGGKKPPKAPQPAPGPAPAPAPKPATTARKYWVTTFADAPGRAEPGGRRTGTLFAARNYVFCKRKGPVVRVGRDHNKWWLKTDLDVGPANQWVSAYYLKNWGDDVAKTDSGRRIPTC